ncbi:MAG: ComEA family DNA-binding protein [Prevotella sp.]
MGIGVLLLFPLFSYAQRETSWEQYFENLVSMEDEESVDREQLYEELCDLAEHPLDINAATREQLEQIPFLSTRQIEQILAHRDIYGEFSSVGELASISSLDYQRRKLLGSLIVIRSQEKKSFPSLREILKYGHHKMAALVQVPLYERKGDQNGYLGSPLKHWMSYEFASMSHVKAGLVATKDAGEPFFHAENSWGYDYYSPYLQITGLWRIKSLVVGRYRATFGMGLVAGTSYSTGKVAALTSMGRMATGIRAYTSRSEADYFQGLATTVALSPRWEMSGWWSYRPVDATLNKNGSISTILTSGYHRTPTEMSKKGNSHSVSLGADVTYRKGGFSIGATSLYTWFDRPLQPNTSQAYRKYYPVGYDFVNTSLHYACFHHLISLRGEVAVNREGGVAAVHALGITADNLPDMVLIHRYYAPQYNTLHGHGFGNASRTQNEHGIYFGITGRLPWPYWFFSSYVDYAYSAEPRYLVSFPSHSLEQMTGIEYRRERWTATARYRIKMTQKDNSTHLKLDNLWLHRLQLSSAYTTTAQWIHTTRAASTYINNVKGDRGWCLSQSVAKNWRKCNMYLGATLFDVSGYDARIYIYEKNLYNSYSSLNVYGRGWRLAAVGGVGVVAGLRCYVKVGVTHYTDRDKIGSDLQTINSPTKADVELQGVWKF